MLAAVYHSDGTIRLEERPVPVLMEERDAIVRITLSSICTSDLHIRDGFVPRAQDRVILGHEFVGEVIAAGSGVHTVRPGDRVAANCITFCGTCEFCKKGYINNCRNGGWKLGCRIDGCQAEYVRVPFADTGLTPIPDGVSDASALFTGDILSSGYFGAELCEIQPGDTIAVIGLGPVGLCAAMCARLMGASRVLGVEPNPARRQTALRQRLVDLALDPSSEDPTLRILQETGGHGADGVIEAAGGKNTFEIAWKSARPNGIVAVVAMYEEDQLLPLPRMYGKNLTFKTGGVDAIHCRELLDWICQGRLNTDFLITHQVPLDRILDGYRIFENKTENCLKVAITPPQTRKSA